jgi:hypothetical protein
MKCEACGADFEPKKPNQKVCSAKCRKAKWRHSHAEGESEVSAEALADLPEIDSGARRGRTVGLTPQIQETICQAIEAGNYQKVAARAAGISEGTLLKWRARGRRGEQPYADLERAIEEADQECEKLLVSRVMGATDKDWRAAAMMLERKYPDRWSRVREQTAGTDGLAVAFSININLNPDPAWLTVNPALDVTPPPDKLN